MTLFDGKPLTEPEVTLRLVTLRLVTLRTMCVCGDPYGVHRVRGDCTRCTCENFVVDQRTPPPAET